jgi:hypothetical protein
VIGDYIVSDLPPLSTKERLVAVPARVREHAEWLEESAGCRLLVHTKQVAAYQERLVAEAHQFEELSKRIAIAACPRDRERRWCPNSVPLLDPRRWCDECIAAREHRDGCALIAIDGRYVGGYPDDGLTPPKSTRFRTLKQPAAHWSPTTHRQHARAVRRRWNAFSDMWMKIGLEVVARYFRGVKWEVAA